MSKAVLLIHLLLLLPLSVYASSSAIHTRPDNFRQGVLFSERIRLRVKDIVIGKTSVKYLFKPMEQKDPTWWEYYSGTENKLSLILNDPNKVEELIAKLIAENKKVSASDNKYLLQVILQDDQDTILKSIFPSRFSKVIDIIIELPCEEITRIIYSRINNIIKDKVQEALKQGETDEPIELNQVFDMLVRDEIEQYLDGLDTVERESPCYKTFQLLKWLRGDDVPGFEFGEYDLNEGLKGLLQPAIDALIETRSNSERYDLGVKIVGYTDEVPVRRGGIELLKENTGLDDWGNPNNLSDIKYNGCSNDYQDGNEPVYIDLVSGRGRQIERRIYNNCELGAVRAYVVINYLVNQLGRESIKYSYATGGICPNIDKKCQGDTRNKRKVKVEFTIKTVNVE